MQILEVVSGDLSNKFILEQLQWLKGNRNEAHLLWQVVWKTGSFSNFLKANSKLKRCCFDFSHEKGRQKGHWMIISLYHSQKTLFFLILVQLFSQPVALMAWRITINSVLTFHLNFLGSNLNLVLSHMPQISSTDEQRLSHHLSYLSPEQGMTDAPDGSAAIS